MTEETMRTAQTDPSRANCRAATVDPDALFVKGREQNRARLICEGCPVRLDCLTEALRDRIEFGVWGGMTERQRRALLRRHPHDWDLHLTTHVPVGGQR
ncbi:WhiB family transcriptional regulator [Nocardiopsis sp. LOL_012]|uniref:WhiB family transcriptional regulator n=1 Tax=Nocardiopsis sp. LOL_012 TaxID=3345409 RepID=UPI003A85E2B4